MKVFLSYRRADTGPIALLVARFLSDVPGVEAVFLDVDDIAVAEDFRARILDELPDCSHVFVLIGASWRGPAGASGAARLFDPDDLVRQEVAHALAAGSTVVPLLVDGAAMPEASALPPDLAGLARLNGYPLRSSHFDDDMYILMRRLTGEDGRALVAPLGARRIARRALLGAAAGGVAVFATALVHHLASTDVACRDLACGVQRLFGLPTREDALGPMVALSAAIVGAGAMLPFVPRWWLRLRGRARV